MKKLFAFVLAIALVVAMVPLGASAAEDNPSGKIGNITWEVENRMLNIEGSGDIPNFWYDDLPPWYAYHDEITGIWIGSGVTLIGEYAFCGLDNITYAVIGDDVKGIGENAFYNTGLYSITIPANVKYVGFGAFGFCKNLQSVTLSEGLLTIDMFAFSDCDSLYEVQVPRSVTLVNDYALGFDTEYNPDTDSWSTYVPRSDFRVAGYSGTAAETYAEKYGLVFISLDEETISGTCGDNLTWEIKGGVLTISGEGAIPDYEYPQSPAPWSVYSYKITSLVIEDGVTGIGNYAFARMLSLIDASIPDTVTYIGDCAFIDCASLERAPLPSGLQSLGLVAFSGCSSLKELVLPEGLTTIPWQSFNNTGLTSVTIPDGVTSIGDIAFNDCASLTSITIPASVESIGVFAFGYYHEDPLGPAVKVDGFTVYGYRGTVAETYANKNGFTFVALDEDDPDTSDPSADPDTEPSTEPTPSPAPDPVDSFADAEVIKDHWGYENIVYAVEHGIMNGTKNADGTVSFDPESPTTRAQIVAILCNLEGEPTADASGKFKDVGNQWYANAVNWAAANGIVSGYENGTFNPNGEITREELAAMLANYAKYKGINTTSDSSVLTRFTDSDKIAGWATEHLSWAVSNGIVNGNANNTVAPGNNTKRVEAASMFKNYCENYNVFTD